jgi:hypothetical protein
MNELLNQINELNNLDKQVISMLILYFVSGLVTIFFGIRGMIKSYKENDKEKFVMNFFIFLAGFMPPIVVVGGFFILIGFCFLMVKIPETIFKLLKNGSES